MRRKAVYVCQQCGVIRVSRARAQVRTGGLRTSRNARTASRRPPKRKAKNLTAITKNKLVLPHSCANTLCGASRNSRRALGHHGFDRCDPEPLRICFIIYQGLRKNDDSATARSILCGSGTSSSAARKPPVQKDCREHVEREVSAGRALSGERYFARMAHAYLGILLCSELRSLRRS